MTRGTPERARTLAWDVLTWTTEYLRQPDGPAAGDAWVFTPEQARILASWYAIDDRGRFVYRRGVLRRMKGHGKDPLLAALAAVELCGPCRFGGFDSEGQPVAIPHPAPWVQVAAVSQDQTRNTMTLFPGLFSPAAIEDYRIDLGKTIVYARGSGRIEAVTSSPRALEGGRPSLVVLNESQEWLQANEGHAMAEVIRRNLAKSNDGSARSVEICNAHLPGEGSVAEATYDAWREAGEIPGLMYDALEAPPVEDLTDRPALRAALLVARGDSRWVDVDRLCDEIADPATREHVARRYYLNHIVAVDSERWLPAGAWDACADLAREIDEGDEVVVGFDGSYNRDSTALVACTVGPDPHLEMVAVWERGPDDPADWIVPAIEVMETIRATCAVWRVREIAADPYLWRSDLEALRDEGLPVVEFKQSGPAMIAACQRVFELVMSGAMSHDGDVDIARHVANAVTKTDARGTRITKASRRSTRHVDLEVAAVMAIDRAATYKPRRRPRATTEVAA
jgi:phage terminase large subunit-like protein